jgi:hypothetical protein
MGTLDILPITEYEKVLHYRKGTLKKAEVVITERSLSWEPLHSDPTDLHYHGKGYIVNCFFRGKLPTSDLVRTVKREKFQDLNLENTPEEKWSTTIEKDFEEKYSDWELPQIDNIIPVFWYSKSALPNSFRGKRYVYLLREHPSPRNILFRKKGGLKSEYLEEYSSALIKGHTERIEKDSQERKNYRELEEIATASTNHPDTRITESEFLTLLSVIQPLKLMSREVINESPDCRSKITPDKLKEKYFDLLIEELRSLTKKGDNANPALLYAINITMQRTLESFYITTSLGSEGIWGNFGGGERRRLK